MRVVPAAVFAVTTARKEGDFGGRRITQESTRVLPSRGSSATERNPSSTQEATTMASSPLAPTTSPRPSPSRSAQAAGKSRGAGTLVAVARSSRKAASPAVSSASPGDTAAAVSRRCAASLGLPVPASARARARVVPRASPESGNTSARRRSTAVASQARPLSSRTVPRRPRARGSRGVPAATRHARAARPGGSRRRPAESTAGRSRASAAASSASRIAASASGCRLPRVRTPGARRRAATANATRAEATRTREGILRRTGERASGGRGGGIPARAIRRASAISAAPPKRRSGSFSRARARKARSAGDTARGPSAGSGVGGSWRIRTASESEVEASNGRKPVSISCRTIPSEKRSLLPSRETSPRTCSGDM